MKKNWLTKFMVLAFAIIMLVVSIPVITYAVGIDFDTSKDDYNTVVSHKTYTVAPGVTEQTVILNDKSGDNQNVCYTMEVDLNNPNVELLSGYKDMDPSNWGTQVTSEQAKVAATKLNKNVVGAINTNLSWASDEPIGMLVIDGVVYHQGTAQAYFVLTKDGKAEIRDGSVPLNGNEWQATATFGMLVQNGVNLYTPNHATGDRAPRTAIGIKANGNVVLFVVDGRQAPYSVGMSAYELAQTMIDLGCITAVNCDGGGTSTFVSKRSGSDELKVQNSPSDGVERPTLGTLMVVSTAKPSGEFDYAILSPNNDLYTPNATIQFSAVGADSSGAKVDLPSDATWQLSDDSKDLGSIDPVTGKFQGTGDKIGVVNVEMVSKGNVVGRTSVQMVHPDKVYFKSEELSLGFSETTSLGLTVKYKNADVNYSLNDFILRQSDDKMGKFNEDGSYTTNDSITINGTIIAQYKHDSNIKAILSLVVGKLPTIVWDFEDVTVVDEITGETKVIPAKEYYTIDKKDENGNQIGKLTTSNYGRGGVQSAEIVSIDDDEPVRMGSHALKLNYDFRNCGAVTEGACIGTTEEFNIPGSPTALGVWVYAPEGTGVLWNGDGTTSGLWLRGYYKDSTGGSTCTYDFTFEPKFFGTDESTWPDKYPGIWWEGWRYCEAKLNGNAPYSILKGMTFRLMFVHGTKMGERTAGSIYFDNFQFVYGSSVDDVDAPYVNQMHINYGTTQIDLVDGVTVNTNQMGFYIDYMDVQNKNTSGIDPLTTRMYIDGVNVNADSYYNTKTDNDGRNYVFGMTLKNGWHTITAYAKDNAGNELKETRRFYVDGDDDLSNIPDVTLEALETKAMLGGKMNLVLKTSDSSKVDSYNYSVKIDRNFPNYTVTFANGYEGTYKYNKLTKTIQIEANKTSETNGNIVATISVDVPTTLKTWDQFSYSLESCQYVSQGEKYTWSEATKTFDIDCMYEISAEPILVNEEGTIRIVSKGAPLDNVSIYLEDGTLLGKTDKNGELKTSYFSNAPISANIYAKDDEGRLSFTSTVSSYAAQGNEDLLPFGVMNHASKNGSLENNITWFTNPNALTQYLRYKESGTSEWITMNANSARIVFTKNGNTMISVHSALIEGLKQDTTYVYQVGDGSNWSKEYTFKTAKLDGKVKFFILGDIQTEDLTQVKAIVEQLNKEGYDFGIQTGDAVDDATSYEYWMNIVELLSADALGDTDIIHVLGNHEFAGDANADRSSLIYNLPVSGYGGHYSVVYDSVYIAVINYTSNRSELAEALEWLKVDAKKTNASWKILVMHQPPYYTNTSGGNNEIHDMVPRVAEEAGIDFVFSGHDHSYARTLPMTNGKVDMQNGVVYFIVGSTGEKSYSVTNNPDFNFARVISDYNSIYLYIEADYNKIDIRCMERGQFGEELDSYVKVKNMCNDPEFVIQGDNVTCSNCEYKVHISNFTGLATDEAREHYYYVENGNIIQTWQFVNEKFMIDGVSCNGWWNNMYYFIDGTRVTGQYAINGIMYTFDEKGIYDPNEIFTGFYNDGIGWTYYIANVQKKGFVAIDESTYYFDDKTGYAPIGSFTLAGNRVYKVEGEKGKVLGAWEYDTIDGVTYKRYYYSLRYYKNAWVEVDGDKYYFGNDGYASVGVRALAVAGKYVGGYEFDKDGKFVRAITGPFTDSISGRMYFAIDGELVCNKLVKFNEDYYFARNNYYLITWPTYISEEQANGLLPAGEYNFGADGKLQMLNGPVVDAGNPNYLNFYKNGVRVYEEGLYEYNGSYYYVRSNGLLLTWGMYIEKTNNLIPAGEYKFGTDGKLQMLNGPVVDAYNSNYLNFYKNGVRVYEEGLYEYNGLYYYVRSNGLLLTWGMYIEKTNNLIPAGEYKFGTDGKLQMLNGPVVDAYNSNYLNFYKNGVRVYEEGLYEYNGSYYYVRSNGLLLTWGMYITKTNGLVPEGEYKFGADGKLQMLNGPVVDAYNSNYLNFYKNGVRVYEEGLYEYNGSYYYVRSNGLLLTWGMYITKTNGLVPEGEYKFGADGKLQMLNGPVVDAYNSNYLNFYKNGVRVYEEGLYEYNGLYYYVRSNGLLLTWRTYIEKTNGLLPAGEYSFDKDGKLVN